jgi:NADPH:quinone reductase-like Zn-dependent oxidoreductase
MASPGCLAAGLHLGPRRIDHGAGDRRSDQVTRLAGLRLLVVESKPHDRVVPKGRHGAYREQIVLGARAVVPAPKGRIHVEACTLPMNGLTARHVIQLAKAAGLTVIGDASEADHQLVKRLDADIIVRRGVLLQSSLSGAICNDKGS